MNEAYGGVLVQRLVESAQFKEKPWPTLLVNDVVQSDIFNIATGAFSPLTGFMGSEDFKSVCKASCLKSGLTWTIPIVFEINEDEKKRIFGASNVFLKSSTKNRLIGFISPTEIYTQDRALRISGTYGVSDPQHPGVQWVNTSAPYLLAGEVTAFADALEEDPLMYPSGIRKRLKDLNLSTVAGFQTRNVVHRAHEYLQRTALELCDGLLVHPVVGWKKKGDFKPEALKHAYRTFIDSYYPRERVLLAFLNVAMRYAGPKEAVFHAIIRKNYGCSHFIVGRDHAGVGGFYGAYDAHQIFDRLSPLGIEILRLREPFYCKRCECIASDKTCGHLEGDREYISGTRIRKILTEGEDPSHFIFRREVLAALKDFDSKEFFFNE